MQIRSNNADGFIKCEIITSDFVGTRRGDNKILYFKDNNLMISRITVLNQEWPLSIPIGLLVLDGLYTRYDINNK